jgi:hypothetical protein
VPLSVHRRIEMVTAPGDTIHRNQIEQGSREEKFRNIRDGMT